MDESRVSDNEEHEPVVNTGHKRCSPSSIDWSIGEFAKNFCEPEESIPLDGAITPDSNGLRYHQEVYEFRNYTKEDIERILREDVQRASDQHQVLSIDTKPDKMVDLGCKPDKMVDLGCPMINNLEAVWSAVGKVFPEYRTASTDTLLAQLERKCPGLPLSWEAGGNLIVQGATTNIRHDDAKQAFAGLKTLVSDSSAEKIIASILAKKIKKLF